jgi:hypothetical protein
MFTSSAQEGWGAVLNEAMACGCAVVASSVAGSTPFLINHNNNGKIYRYGNDKNAYRAVKELLLNKEEAEMLGKNAMKTIAVSYLTANDENMIVSPNLYRDGLILDYLLKAKIKNSDIDPDDLLEGDRDAIILWLRATGYGLQYPITVTDNITGVEFDTVVDLSQIKHKPFLLKGDTNGCFDFVTPNTKDFIKFKFLTHGDIKYIDTIERNEQISIKKERLMSIVTELNSFLEHDEDLTKDEKMKLYDAKRNINKWAENIEIDSDLGYTHKLTNRLEMSIVSINGNDDREYISDYVNNMNVGDALALRRYINENEPGLDFLVEVERPESLGGGSMPVFLTLDEYVFLNIS